MKAKASHAKSRGFALVVMLAVIVLLTFVVIALFTRSTSHLRSETSSWDRSAAEELARTGGDYLSGLIREEIIDNSTADTQDGVTTYFPTSPQFMVPQRQLQDTDLNHNFGTLLKQTSENFGGGSAISSSTASANQRSISAARWGKPQLFAEGAALSNNQFPTWTYITRQGVRENLTWSDHLMDATSANYVVGRFAANVYEIGGLLDVNVAGYRDTAPLADRARKGSLVWSDLSVLDGTTSAIQQATGLPQWRFKGNHATLSELVAGTGSVDSGAGGPGGWLVPNTSGSPNDQDNRITSRQELIRMAQRSGAPFGFNEQALPYMTHWTRFLASPSFRPDPNRPRVRAIAQGGNDAVGEDDGINPSFLATRVTDPFNRRTYDLEAGDWRNRTNPDGSPLKAQAGEQLVRYRFPLDRLSLVTRTATAPASETNPIYALFGLSRGSASDPWTYDHGDSGRIMRLSEVAAAGREPDFFELLKAAIHAGSIGKSSGFFWQIGRAQELLDGFSQSFDQQVIEIGSNILDQADADGFPTRVQIGDRILSGVENLPYLMAIRQITPQWKLSSNGVRAVGVTKYLIQPEIWNPHAQVNQPTSLPSQFRVVAIGSSIRVLAGPNVSPAALSQWAIQLSGPPDERWTSLPPVPGDPTLTPGQQAPVYMDLTPANSEMLFNAGFSDFREPAALSGNNSIPGAGNTEGYFVSTGASRSYAPDPASLSGPGPHAINVGGMFLGYVPWQAQSAIVSVADPGIDFELQYFDDLVGDFVTYFGATDAPSGRPVTPLDVGNIIHFTHNSVSRSVFADPRTPRFGNPGGNYSPVIGAPGSPWAAGETLDGKLVWTWNELSTAANRGWTLAPIPPNSYYAFGEVSRNTAAMTTRYTDADGTLRRAMGAYASGTAGLPLISGNSGSRPIVLNRPFRSVGELGYVFSGTPWKNLDFMTRESGNTALLDVFSIHDSPDAGLVAGRINPNTTPVDSSGASPVLTAALSETLRDEANLSALQATTTSEAVSRVIRNFIASSSAGEGPLLNRGDLVGRYASGGYRGIADNLSSALSGDEAAIERQREASIRALADVSETRTWNLLIDVVAQSGRFGLSADSLDDFTVQGEARNWIYVAIDRFTGDIVATEVEKVFE